MSQALGVIAASEQEEPLSDNFRRCSLLEAAWVYHLELVSFVP
jgi:hypothetical protein